MLETKWFPICVWKPHTAEAMMRRAGSDTRLPSSCASRSRLSHVLRVSAQKNAHWTSAEGHLQGSARAPPVSSGTEQQTLVLLLVWGPSTALCRSQQRWVGLLLFLYRLQKIQACDPHICAPGWWRWTLRCFRYSLLSPAVTRTQIKGALCGATTHTLGPSILLWPSWDLHLHQSWFRASLWRLPAPLIFKNI